MSTVSCSSVCAFVNARETELVATRARLAEVTRQLKELQAQLGISAGVSTIKPMPRPTKCLMCDEPYGDGVVFPPRCGRTIVATCGHKGHGQNCCKAPSAHETYCDEKKHCLLSPDDHACFACRTAYF